MYTIYGKKSQQHEKGEVAFLSRLKDGSPLRQFLWRRIHTITIQQYLYPNNIRFIGEEMVGYTRASSGHRLYRIRGRNRGMGFKNPKRLSGCRRRERWLW